MINNYIEKNIFYLLLFLPIAIIVGQLVSTSCIIIICVSFLFLSLIKNDWSWINDKYTKILLILYAYLIFNSLIASDHSLSLARNLGFLRYIILIAAIRFILADSKNRNLIANAWLIIILIVSFDIYYEFTFKQNILGFKSIYADRITSFFKDEAVVGGYLLAFLLIILGFIFEKKIKIFEKYGLIKFIVISILISSIIITGERSNTIKMIIGLLFFFAFIKNISYKKKFIYLLLLISILSTLIYFIDDLRVRYYLQIFNQINSQEKIKTYKDNNMYFKHYSAAYEIFKINPLFGVGNKNFGKSCFANKEIHLKKGICSTHPHQIYFELLSEHGIIGAFIIIGLIFYIVFLNIKSFIKFRNYIHLGTIIFIFLSFLPIIPGGAFFGNSFSTLFWLNFSFMLGIEKIASFKNDNKI